MARAFAPVAAEIEHYLATHQRKSLLRFITCGSVDDGKSTLIGRLLYESKLLFEDQLAALEADSRKMGTQGDGLDFALVTTGSPMTRGVLRSRLRRCNRLAVFTVSPITVNDRPWLPPISPMTAGP